MSSGQRGRKFKNKCSSDFFLVRLLEFPVVRFIRTTTRHTKKTVIFIQISFLRDHENYFPHGVSIFSTSTFSSRKVRM